VKKNKTEILAVHLFKVFKSNPSKTTLKEENRLLPDNTISATLNNLTKSFTINEVKAIIKSLNPKKEPGYDLRNIANTAEAARNVNNIHIQVNNAVLRRDLFSSQWMVVQIIIIQKPGKPAELTESYKPISLFPVL